MKNPSHSDSLIKKFMYIVKKNLGNRHGTSFYRRNWFQKNILNNAWYQFQEFIIKQYGKSGTLTQMIFVRITITSGNAKKTVTKYTWNHYQVLLELLPKGKNPF